MRKMLACGFVLTGLAVAGAAPDEPVVSGFKMPIAGACLPKSDKLMPNAPREYRKGTHEGVDFYNSDSCTRVTKGTQVLAAKAGKVIRVDRKYVDVNKKQVDAFLANPDTPASLDQFRGRQVWIDHGGSIVTRYCHLNGVATGFEVGSQIPGTESNASSKLMIFLMPWRSMTATCNASRADRRSRASRIFLARCTVSASTGNTSSTTPRSTSNAG